MFVLYLVFFLILLCLFFFIPPPPFSFFFFFFFFLIGWEYGRMIAKNFWGWLVGQIIDGQCCKQVAEEINMPSMKNP